MGGDIKMPEAGESLMREDLGVMPMVKFQLVYHKGGKKPYVIEPWKGQEAEITEWYRNDSAMSARRVRNEEAAFTVIAKDSPVYINDSLIQDKTHDLAIFHSSVDGDKFDVAARLVPKNIKPTDRVKLTILGCCSIINVEKI
jgi:hypothetical protein